MTAFRLSNLIVLLVVVIAAAIAAVLLGRTVTLAQNINAKAGNIAHTGRGINLATDSVVQLTRTNRTATSILRSAEPLEGQLNRIIREARTIDATAKSINNNAQTINGTARTIDNTAEDILGTARTINRTAGGIGGTAGAINQTAGAIRGTAASIFNLAGRIDRDVRLINVFLNETLCLASGATGGRGGIPRGVGPRGMLRESRARCTRRVIRRGGIAGDTGNIVLQAEEAHQTAACIDFKVAGATPGGQDPSSGEPALHCQGGQDRAPQSAAAASASSQEPRTPEANRQSQQAPPPAPTLGFNLELPRGLPPDLNLRIPELDRRLPRLGNGLPEVPPVPAPESPIK